MKVSLVQYNPAWENKNHNKEKINFLLKNYGIYDSLLIFPEMTLTGFTMYPKDHAEKIDGESLKYFSRIADQYNSHTLVGIIEEKNDRFFNSLIHINNSGKLINIYRKIHPFSYSDEDKNYSRGDEVIITEINEFKTGLSICYDLRFPELFRKYGKERAELLVVIANWPVTRIEHWRTLLKARAIENQCYVAGVNRVGSDPKLNYSGYSSIFDPMGNEVITSENKEEILIAEISVEKVKEVREKLPFLNDIHLI